MKPSKDLVPQNGSILSKYSEEQKEIIRNYICKDANDSEMLFFLQVCDRVGLDAFSKQIYLIKRGGKPTIQISIDGFRTIASRTKELAGIDEARFYNKAGQESEESKYPHKAVVTVYRFVKGEKVAFVAAARWEEYRQAFNGKLSGLWESMPYLMLGKCAESLALRKAFPHELSGVYTKEEMMQADEEDKLPEAHTEPRVDPSILKATNDKLEIMKIVHALGYTPTDTEAWKSQVHRLVALDIEHDPLEEILSRLRLLQREKAEAEAEAAEKPIVYET